MIVTREDIRVKVVSTIKAALEAEFPDIASRTRWPGFPRIDVTENKKPYMNVAIVYLDAEKAGIGKEAPTRNMGMIQLECCYKEGDREGLLTVNALIDRMQKLLGATDDMFPLRTYEARNVSPRNGPQEGWQEEGLVTPFWFDSSKS